jgi:N-acylneuraminate cytidylyltransferase
VSEPPQTVWAVILARAGSRSIPRKNLAVIGGRPLVLIAVEQAVRCPEIHRVVVSTDDADIARLCAAFDVDVVERPAELATDQARSAPAVIHALGTLGAAPSDIAVLLQPTSPMRADGDIRSALVALNGYRSSVTVEESFAHPLKALIESPTGYVPTRSLEDLERPRQELPRAVTPNGAVYVIRVGDLAASKSFLVAPINPVLMPPERSIDIDSPGDLAQARSLFGSGEDSLGPM